MSKNKKENIEVNSDNDDFIYCSQRHCPHRACLRHNINTPFNVIIYRRMFNPDKDWNCKDMVI